MYHYGRFAHVPAKARQGMSSVRGFADNRMRHRREGSAMDTPEV